MAGLLNSFFDSNELPKKMSRPIAKKHLTSLRRFAVEELYCPITRELFHDPVVAADGIVYERSAILKWFSRRCSSPTTGLTITTTLHDCIFVRRTIEVLSSARLLPPKDVASLRAKGKPQRSLQTSPRTGIPVAELVHAFHCNTSCQRAQCSRLKVLIARMQQHRRDADDNHDSDCRICKLLVALERTSPRS